MAGAISGQKSTLLSLDELVFSRILNDVSKFDDLFSTFCALDSSYHQRVCLEQLSKYDCWEINLTIWSKLLTGLGSSERLDMFRKIIGGICSHGSRNIVLHLDSAFVPEICTVLLDADKDAPPNPKIKHVVVNFHWEPLFSFVSPKRFSDVPSVKPKTNWWDFDVGHYLLKAIRRMAPNLHAWYLIPSRHQLPPGPFTDKLLPTASYSPGERYRFGHRIGIYGSNAFLEHVLSFVSVNIFKITDIKMTPFHGQVSRIFVQLEEGYHSNDVSLVDNYRVARVNYVLRKEDSLRHQMYCSADVQRAKIVWADWMDGNEFQSEPQTQLETQPSWLEIDVSFRPYIYLFLACAILLYIYLLAASGIFEIYWW